MNSLSPLPITSLPSMSSRLAYFDFIRTFAIVLVVVFHAWENFILPLPWVHTLGGYSFYQLMQISCRLSIPLFIMLTGALMLDRPYPDIGSFIARKIPRFLGALVIAATVYTFLSHILFNTAVKGGVGRFLRGDPIGGYHLWYLYMLIGLYMSLPYLARLLANLTRKELTYLLAGSLILVMLPWTLADIGSRFAYFISFSFLLQTYAIYAVTGYWLHKYGGLKNLSVTCRCLLLVLVAAAAVLTKLPAVSPLPAPALIWYDSVFMYSGGTLLFSLIRDLYPPQRKSGKIITSLAPAAYAVYLWHVVIITLAVSLQEYYGLNAVLLFIMTITPAILFGILCYRLLRTSPLNWLVR